MSGGHKYTEKDYAHLKGLKNIPDEQITIHLGLYKGYVTNTNVLNEKLTGMAKDGKAGTPEWAELSRRMGFEYNGMRLHEYYFDNLAPGGKGQIGGKLKEALEKSFGSTDAWKADFVATGKMRGVGWAVLFQDPVTGTLSNHWITLHEDGNPPGFAPVLVMDVWEHAFMKYKNPAQRAEYIDDFFLNVNWDTVAARVK